MCGVVKNTGREAESENSSRLSAGQYEIQMSGKNPPAPARGWQASGADKCPTYFGHLREKSRAVVPGRLRYASKSFRPPKVRDSRPFGESRQASIGNIRMSSCFRDAFCFDKHFREHGFDILKH